MSTFKPLQRKNSTSSTRAVPTSHRLRSSRPIAPAPIPTPEQTSPNQQMQPTHDTHLKYSLADIPISSPERENHTGLPDNLKADIEHLSGVSMDDVHVHYNSSKPAKVLASAYTQGTEIHVGPGQEKYLGHEIWHVVQQKQGRVQPSWQEKGVAINNDEGLEKEAEGMGAFVSEAVTLHTTGNIIGPTTAHSSVILQRVISKEQIDKIVDALTKTYKGVPVLSGKIKAEAQKIGIASLPSDDIKRIQKSYNERNKDNPEQKALMAKQEETEKKQAEPDAILQTAISQDKTKVTKTITDLLDAKEISPGKIEDVYRAKLSDEPPNYSIKAQLTGSTRFVVHAHLTGDHEVAGGYDPVHVKKREGSTKELGQGFTVAQADHKRILPKKAARKAAREAKKDLDVVP